MAVVTNGLTGYFHFTNMYVPKGTEQGYETKTWTDVSPSGELITLPTIKPFYYRLTEQGANIHTSSLIPVELYPSASLMDGTHRSFGYEFWFKGNVPIGDVSMDKDIYLMYWSSLNPNTNLHLKILKTGQLELNFVNYPDGTYWSGGATFTLNSMDAFLDWTHFGLYYDAITRTLSLYANSELLYKSAPSPQPFIPFKSGSLAWVMGNAVNYNLASIKVYNRALTANEVLRNYDSGWETQNIALSTNPPAQPTNLRSSSVTGNSISLQWDDVSDTDSFILKRNGVTILDTNTLSFTDTGLVPNTTYNYELIAKNYIGSSIATTLSVKTLNVSYVTTVEDFEDSTILFNPTGDWAVTNTAKNSGVYSFKSKTIGNSATSTATFTIVVPTGALNPSISFWYRVSSESGYDKFTAKIDNFPVINAISGEKVWTKYEAPTTVGTHTLTLTYSKDSSTAVGADSAYIDDLTMKYEIVNSEPTDGTDVSFEYELTQKIFQDVDISFDTKQLVFEDFNGSYDTKQVHFEDSIQTMDMRNIIYEDYSVLLNAKQIIFEETYSGLHETKQVVFEDVSVLFDTLQELLDSGIMTTTMFDLSLILYSDDLKTYDTKQVIYEDASKSYDTKQSLYQDEEYTFDTLLQTYELTQINHDLKQIIYEDTTNLHSLKQELYENVSYEHNTMQKLLLKLIPDYEQVLKMQLDITTKNTIPLAFTTNNKTIIQLGITKKEVLKLNMK